MVMSSNTTDFFAYALFTDQPARIYTGTNMGINAQMISKENSLQYFSMGTYLYAGGLSDQDLAVIAESSMNGNGDM